MNKKQQKLIDTAFECLDELTEEIAVDDNENDGIELWNMYVTLGILYDKHCDNDD